MFKTKRFETMEQCNAFIQGLLRTVAGLEGRIKYQTEKTWDGVCLTYWAEPAESAARPRCTCKAKPHMRGCPRYEGLQFSL